MDSDNLTFNQARALGALSERLSHADIPFIVVGGLAAIAWGVQRPLVDIDIQVSKENMVKTRNLFSNNLEVNIRHYKSVHWDIQQMIIKLHGVGVDICQAENFYIVTDDDKYLLPNLLDRAVYKDVCGIQLPVLPKEMLINYKRKVARQVDLDDLKSLEE